MRKVHHSTQWCSLLLSKIDRETQTNKKKHRQNWVQYKKQAATKREIYCFH